MNNNIDPQQISIAVERAMQAAGENYRADTLGRCIAMLDYTTLKESDSPQSISHFVEQAMSRCSAAGTYVAAICVYPSLVDSVGVALENYAAGQADRIAISAVCGGFPSGQTYLEVKLLECAMAVENGADEIDIPINVSSLLAGDYDQTESEIRLMREEIGTDAQLKVILETGTLADPQLIYRASMLAMQAGADFIKTSTGKAPIGATPAAAVIMCLAIADYYQLTSRRVGIKFAGGITTSAEAILYYTIVEQNLGDCWLDPSLMRIGASRLLEALVVDKSSL